jgi:predicted CoA-binding protein
MSTTLSKEFGTETASDISMNTSLSAEEREVFQNSKQIRRLLANARTIAVVGLSTEKTKASNMVASYLKDEGYRVIPVNPRATEILGEKCYPDLKSVPEPIDIVNVFRPASAVPGIVDEALEVGAKSLWLQLRIVERDAAQRAADHGMDVVMDRCIKMEHGRYCGALHFAGMNTEVITAKRRSA